MLSRYFVTSSSDEKLQRCSLSFFEMFVDFCAHECCLKIFILLWQNLQMAPFDWSRIKRPRSKFWWFWHQIKFKDFLVPVCSSFFMIFMLEWISAKLKLSVQMEPAWSTIKDIELLLATCYCFTLWWLAFHRWRIREFICVIMTHRLLSCSNEKLLKVFAQFATSVLPNCFPCWSE